MRLQLTRLCLAAVLAITGSGCDFIKDRLSPTSPTPVGPPAAGVAVSYSAIGASDALGVGASVPCQLFSPCESGTGYVPQLAREMRAQSRDVTTVNLGIPAAVLSPAIQTIARSHGRDVPANFIDHELAFLAPGATLVTVFAGGNDANAIGFAMQRGAHGTDITGYVDTQIRTFGTDYDRLIQGIKSRAPSAFIIVINLPNLAAFPYAAGYTQQERQVLQRLSVGFSREANRQAGSGVVVLDLMCDAAVYDRSRLAADGFHPNDAGYAYLAQRLLAIVNGGASSAAASCSQMQVVPAL
jgi:lysophospholipase L1-like esterase